MKVQIVKVDISPFDVAIYLREGRYETRIPIPIDKVLTTKRLKDVIKEALSKLAKVRERVKILDDLRYKEIELGEEHNERV